MKYVISGIISVLILFSAVSSIFAQADLATPEENKMLKEMRVNEEQTENTVVKEETPESNAINFQKATQDQQMPLQAQAPVEAAKPVEAASAAETAQAYTIGIDDVLDMSILQPEQLTTVLTVSPDGTVNVPYAGSVKVAGMSLPDAQELIRSKLADGYLKYPVVALALKENRSKKFFVYGEVMKPGTYLLSENMTILKAISTAGGFTKFGSTSRVKVLRPKKDGSGYETIKVNLDSAMKGNSKADIMLDPGDTVIISEGIF